MLRAATLAWVAVILWVTLNPEQPTDGRWVRDALSWWTERGLPAWVTYDVVEFTANVALFLPFGLLLSLVLRGPLSERSESKGARGSSSREAAYRDLPALPLLTPTVLSLALSLSIEFTQSAFLPARFATGSDLLANTVGGFLGAALVVIWPRRRALPR
ncbi:MAG TPA: VanZ family protein [Microbacteriaceae bacterium]|nr:VanZ family protein [Microbacteriaceae bacterium]